jgi:hypothetical protein
MARISKYGLDINLSLLDKWIGTDSNGGATKNFTAQAIADLFNAVNAISISGQNNFKFQTDSTIGRKQGTISFENFNGNNTAFADVTEIKVSKKSSSTKDTESFISALVGENIIIAHTAEPNNFGIYKLLSYEEDPLEPTYYIAELDLVVSNGALKSNEDYGIAIYSNGDIVGDKTYVHNQTVASNSWSVSHDLNKYPAVVIVDSGDNVVVGDIQYIDLNNIIITFTSTFSGKAYFN